MAFKKMSVPATLLILLLHLCATAQTTNALPRSVPELEGVSSEGIVQFLEAAGKSKHEFHSIMMLRHGKVMERGPARQIFETPQTPYTQALIAAAFNLEAIGVDRNVVAT